MASQYASKPICAHWHIVILIGLSTLVITGKTSGRICKFLVGYLEIDALNSLDVIYAM